MLRHQLQPFPHLAVHPTLVFVFLVKKSGAPISLPYATCHAWTVTLDSALMGKQNQAIGILHFPVKLPDLQIHQLWYV